MLKKSLKIPKGQSETEEEQTPQWPKEEVQNDNGDLQNITQKTKYRVTRTRLKIGGGGTQVLPTICLF